MTPAPPALLVVLARFVKLERVLVLVVLVEVVGEFAIGEVVVADLIVPTAAAPTTPSAAAEPGGSVNKTRRHANCPYDD